MAFGCAAARRAHAATPTLAAPATKARRLTLRALDDVVGHVHGVSSARHSTAAARRDVKLTARARGLPRLCRVDHARSGSTCDDASARWTAASSASSSSTSAAASTAASTRRARRSPTRAASGATCSRRRGRCAFPILRWPGGNFVSGYHWLDGVGPEGRAAAAQRARLVRGGVEPLRHRRVHRVLPRDRAPSRSSA